MATAREEDLAFCAELLPRVSRTFALSIEALPEELREAIRVAYLLCRIVDTIEDEPAMEVATRHELFDIFERCMLHDTEAPEPFEALVKSSNLGGESDDGDLCRRSGAVFRVFRSLSDSQRDAIRPHVIAMSTGMRSYAGRVDVDGKLRIYDISDLERYCYYVAGTVGELLTKLFHDAVPTISPEARVGVEAAAVSFGLGLQMVNIVKDVSTDIRRGVCYLPEDLAREHGIDSLDHVLDPEHRQAGLEVVRAVTARARHHLERAREYTLAWPEEEGREVRLFCAVPLTLALATLTLVESGHDTLEPGATPKVTREVVGEVLQRAVQAVESNDALREMFAHYAGDLPPTSPSASRVEAQTTAH